MRMMVCKLTNIERLKGVERVLILQYTGKETRAGDTNQMCAAYDELEMNDPENAIAVFVVVRLYDPHVRVRIRLIANW